MIRNLLHRSMAWVVVCALALPVAALGLPHPGTGSHSAAASAVLWTAGASAATALDEELVLGGAPSRIPAELTAAERAEHEHRLNDTLRRLDMLMEVVEELRFNIDRTQFDVEALALHLQSGGAERITQYVKEQIFFEQYEGLLRGAKGTLMARAGNALDQAVLLATLMTQSGYEARIASVVLEPSQARDLLQEMSVERPDPPAAVDHSLLQDIVEELLDIGELDSGSLRTDMDALAHSASVLQHPDYSDVVADTQLLIELLTEAGIVLGDPHAEDKLIEEARDYYWVQYRRASTNPWRSAHPAFGDSPAWLADLEPADSIDGEVPADLQHRLRVAAYLEQNFGRQKRTHTLMPPWERPVANLVGEPLVYQNLPDSLPDLSDALDFDPAATLAEARFFFPTFNQAVAPGALAFDRLGNVVDPEAAANPMAGVFATGAERIGQAAGLIDSLGERESDQAAPEDFISINEVWLEYTLIEPGGRERVFRRDLVSERAGRERLVSEHTFMVFGSLSEGFMLDAYLGRILDMHALLRALLRVQLDYRSFSVPVSDLVFDSRWLGHLELYWLMNWGNSAESSVDTYHSHPPLVIIERKNLTSSPPTLSVDIVSNTRRVRSMKPRSASDAAGELVRMGVWETYAESISIGADHEDPRFAVGAIRAANERSERLAVLHPSGTDETESSWVPDGSASGIQQDLQEGYVVVLPTGAAAKYTGWWRINPVTGEALGRGLDGRGATFVEKAIELFLPHMTITSGIISLGVFAGCHGLAYAHSADGWNGTCLALFLGTSGVLAIKGSISFYLLASLLAVLEGLHRDR